jgi:hypothetical protein
MAICWTDSELHPTREIAALSDVIRSIEVARRAAEAADASWMTRAFRNILHRLGTAN